MCVCVCQSLYIVGLPAKPQALCPISTRLMDLFGIQGSFGLSPTQETGPCLSGLMNPGPGPASNINCFCSSGSSPLFSSPLLQMILSTMLHSSELFFIHTIQRIDELALLVFTL